MHTHSPINWILIFGLLILGTGVFLVSLYFASIAGLRNKLGLVGGDLRTAVHPNELSRGAYEAGGIPTCDFKAAVVPIPQYLVARPEERVQLGLRLGELRIKCGIAYILQGNVDRGVFTLIKGMYYERANSQETLELVEHDRQQCAKLFDAERDYGYVEAFLEASEGNSRSVVESIYSEVRDVRGRVAERCLDADDTTF